MGEQPRDAENTTRAFFKEYMVNRNVEATLGWLTDDVHWIGTGKGEYSCGKEQVLNALEQEFSLDPDAYQLIWEDIRENRLTPDCAVMQGRLTVVRTLPDGKEFAMGARLTSACVRTAEGFRVASIHASAPAGIQEEGEFFPLSFAESVSREYARRMGRSALELLGKNIPGGMLGTYLESGFPLYYVNDRMLAYLGYTYEEFSQATRGRVAVNGRDVREYTQNGLRSRIGVVPQRAVLFKGTLRDNMRWGRADASDEDIYRALDIAQAREFVDQKGDGLELFISQEGKNLSGGQRQRLTIARALVRKPDILILDDSASALDFATDARLRSAIRRGTGSMTVFIVSQRAASIKQADRILVLDDGRIAGQGTHRELLRDCSVYREICLSQLSKEEVERDEQ